MHEIVSDKSWELLENCPIQNEYDIVKARQIVRQYAKEAGMGIVDQTRITTAVSELFRNMFMYAGGGEVLIEKGIVEDRNALIITCIDKGPGIENIDLVMTDGYTSGQGMGYGLPGSKRLVDIFEIYSKLNVGTTVRITKWR
jgi:serine/threonine-protein kinase RsbT